MFIFSVLLLYFFAIFTRYVKNTTQIIWFSLIWAVLAFILGMVFGSPLNILFIVVLIKLPFVYIWLRLLYYLEDTIFLYLLILIIGGGLIGIF
jgi:hypothetical protein